MPDEDKPHRPWRGFDYVVLVTIAVLVAWFVVRPLGQQVAVVFQTLTQAMGGH